MSPVIHYDPPTGRPLGSNKYFAFGAGVLIPVLRVLVKRDWRGVEHIPATGPVIVICNHISYADPLVFADFLFSNGRAPRFIGKESVFKVPVIGKIIAGSGQIPVSRESKDASAALDHAKALLQSGHCLGVYPEGTLTRDPQLWPQVAKTGIARLAIQTRVLVIPCAQWGDQSLLPRYSSKLVFWKRHKVTIVAGAPLDFSPWYGKEDDQAALVEATAYAMAAIRSMLEHIRGERAPAQIFDPHTSELPRVGNFVKAEKKRSKR
jgi:1-acyl-sn-glycerol-3-phosphate acyltransferase